MEYEQFETDDKEQALAKEDEFLARYKRVTYSYRAKQSPHYVVTGENPVDLSKEQPND